MKAAISNGKLKGKTLVAVASGANMNFDRLRYIAERAELVKSGKPCWLSPFPKRRAVSRPFVRCWRAQHH